MLLDSVTQWYGGKCFKWLMTKFTSPEELFGSLNFSKTHKDLPEGGWEEKIQFGGRNSLRKLQEADLAFLDEIWKSSSAILNSLLRIMNEGTFDDGEKEIRVPLKLLVAASNEYPSAFEGGKELSAIFDRFLLRKDVKPITTQEGRKKLLWKEDHKPKLSTSLTRVELHEARTEVRDIHFTDQSQEMVEEILGQLRKEGIIPGDRRQFKSVGVCKAAAWLEGSPVVEPNHLEVLAHCLWDDPGEQPRKCAQVVARIANPIGMLVNSLILQAEEVVSNTNFKELKELLTADAKLKEVLKELKKIPSGNGRVIKATSYVQGKIKEILMHGVGRIE